MRLNSLFRGKTAETLGRVILAIEDCFPALRAFVPTLQSPGKMKRLFLFCTSISHKRSTVKYPNCLDYSITEEFTAIFFSQIARKRLAIASLIILIFE